MKTINTATVARVITLLDTLDELQDAWTDSSLIDPEDCPELHAVIDKLRNHRVSIREERIGKRCTDLTSFGTLLSRKIDEIAPGRAVYRIDAPEARGDVTIILRATDEAPQQAITYKADGTWSALSYWCEGQI